MAAPAAAAPVAGVYVAGAALLAGAAYLMTPAGQRASQSFGEAVIDGGSQAVDNIRDLFRSEDDAQATPVAQTGTATQTQERKCDGPHRGRLQVQGYKRGVDPVPVELSWPWTRDCRPPLRPEGLSALSAILLPQTMAISGGSAGWRGPAFSKMSQYISNSPPMGFTPANSGGWSITETGGVVRNFGRGAGRNAPRVDLDIFVGRAFGDF